MIEKLFVNKEVTDRKMDLEARMHRVKINSPEEEKTNIEEEEEENNSIKQLVGAKGEDIKETDPEQETEMSTAESIVKDIQAILNMTQNTDMKMKSKENLKHYNAMIETVSESMEMFRTANNQATEDKLAQK